MHACCKESGLYDGQECPSLGRIGRDLCRLHRRQPDLSVPTAVGRIAVAAADGGAVRFSATPAAAALCALRIPVPSAYALARLRFRRPVLRPLVMLGMLSVQLISPLVTALP